MTKGVGLMVTFWKSSEIGSFVKKHAGFFFALLAIAIIAAEPAFAANAAKPIEGTLEWLVEVLQGSIARSLAIIAICFAGFMFFTGRMQWQLCLSIVVGIALVFGAGELVDSIKGSAS
jgi:type IV secretion system protein VirB2